MATAQQRKRQLNPAFASAHGLANNDLFPRASHIDRVLSQARKTGKVQAVNAGLISLDVILQWPPVAVDLSLDRYDQSWNAHDPGSVTSPDISDNAVEWDERLCQTYTSLRTLRAKKCHLSTVRVEPLPFLVTLDLSGNRLTHFDLSLIPKSVQYLDLSDNQLEYLGDCKEDIVINLPNMVALNVGQNNLTAIPSLRATQLQTLYCESNQLNSLAFLLQNGESKLTTLVAGNNRVKQLSHSLPDTLVKLDLSQNRIASIHQHLPTSLSRLVLNDNYLTQVDLAGCHDLVEVLVNNNKLTQAPFSVETSMKIKILDLRNNHIDNLPYAIGFLPDLQQLQLEGNPLRFLRSADTTTTQAILQVLRNRAPNEGASGQYSTMKSMLMKHRLGDATILSLENQGLSDFPLLSDLKTHVTVATRIERLVLNGNHLSSLEWLYVLPNLTSLEANKNKLCSLPDLSTSRLVELHLSGNRLETIVDLPPTLKVLDVSRNWLLTFTLPLSQVLRILNLSGNRLISVHVKSPVAAALETMDLSDNKLENLDDIPLELAAHCPHLQTLLLQNNEMHRIPLELGLLLSLRCIDLKGNPQHGIRYQILEKSCAEILLYLRNRMTPEQLDKANAEIEKRKRYKPSSALNPPVIPLSPACQMATDTSNVVKATPDVAARNTAQPIADANRSARTSPPAPNATQEYSPIATTTSPNFREQGDGNGIKALSINAPIESPILNELKESIMKLSNELETNLSLSQAKRYALKKELAMERSKLIREERRLHQKNLD